MRLTSLRPHTSPIRLQLFFLCIMWFIECLADLNNTPRNVLNSRCHVICHDTLHLLYHACYITISLSFYLELLCHNTYSNLSCHGTYTSNLSVMLPSSLSVILPGNLCVMFPSNLSVIITNMQALCHFAKQLLFFSWPLNFSSQTALCLFICSIAISFLCHL